MPELKLQLLEPFVEEIDAHPVVERFHVRPCSCHRRIARHTAVAGVEIQWSRRFAEKTINHIIRDALTPQRFPGHDHSPSTRVTNVLKPILIVRKMLIQKFQLRRHPRITGQCGRRSEFLHDRANRRPNAHESFEEFSYAVPLRPLEPAERRD